MAKYTYLQEQQMLCDSFARRMLVEHGLKEVTTQRQAKNGTRIFLCPTGELLGSYSSGYVRRCDSSDRIYQLNRQYQQNKRHTWFGENGLVTNEYIGTARALIFQEFARLNFILEYYLKNYKK